MLKIIRLYHQNRKKVWFALIIAIFSIAMIRLLSQAYQEQSKAHMQKMAQQMETHTQQEEEDTQKALTTGEKVQNSIKNEIQEVLEQFVKSVCQNKTQEAYSYLTRECKQIQYPSVEIFAQSYCSDVLNKTYDFQLWATGTNLYVYQVKFMDDLLTTGRDTSKNYIQDYITIVKQDRFLSIKYQSINSSQTN